MKRRNRTAIRNAGEVLGYLYESPRVNCDVSLRCERSDAVISVGSVEYRVSWQRLATFSPKFIAGEICKRHNMKDKEVRI